MSKPLVAFFIALSVSVWAYTKIDRRSMGSNTKASLGGAGMIFVIVFIIAYSVAAKYL